MRVAYFTHSLASCWNHGNAHFLRGVLRELVHRGHAVSAHEPCEPWSLQNLLKDHGEAGLSAYREAYPELSSRTYGSRGDLDAALSDADLVLVHEWNEPWLVAAIGAARRRGARFTLLFHDTHHRAVSDPDAIRRFDLDGYDGVLAFGEALADVYRRWGWGERVFVWHEAADTRLFQPPEPASPLVRGEGLGPEGARRAERSGGEGALQNETLPDTPSHPDGSRRLGLSPHAGRGDGRAGLVWIGNWGDDERSRELEDFLFRPARTVGLPLDVYGVRYPDHARDTLGRYGARYRGWLPNAKAPEVFARHLATVHVPRRFYVEMLPGIPTIRVFEALACGIPLVSAPWRDTEGLFRIGQDFLMARDEAEMERHLRAIRDDADLRQSLVQSGLETIRARHSCAHRVDELLAIVQQLGAREPMEVSV